MIKNSTKLLKQRLQRVHVVTGITFSLLMYISVFFGIFAILLPYIQIWEKPSRHFQVVDITKIDYSSMVDPIISNPEYLKDNIHIELPGYRGDRVLKISHKPAEEIIFNPTTYQEINDEGVSKLAWFLNHMHYGRPFKTFGYIVFGFTAVAGMFLIIGGVLQVILIKYTNRGKTKKSKLSKWHRKIFIWVFPPFIIIILTGGLMNIGYLGSAPMTYLASHGQTYEIKQIIKPILYPDKELIEKKNDTVKMLPINELIKKAKVVNPKIDFKELTLMNWRDSTAQIELSGYNPYMPFLNGIYNDPTVILAGVDGHLIKNIKVLDKHWGVLLSDSLYFLHLLLGVDIFTRIFVALVMATSAFALGFGVMLWLEKRTKKTPSYYWMEKLSLAIMIGVIPSTGLIFALQWLLPFDLTDRFLWQKGMFFIFWLATLAWSFYRINLFQAAKEFLFLGGVLFITASLSHMLVGNWSPIKLLNNGMLGILSVDIVLIIIGIILLFVSGKIPKNREDSKLFWSKKSYKINRTTLN